jgi:hypothetical protein
MKTVYFDLAGLLFLQGFAVRSHDLFSAPTYITTYTNPAFSKSIATLNKDKVLFNCSTLSEITINTFLSNNEAGKEYATHNAVIF